MGVSRKTLGSPIFLPAFGTVAAILKPWDSKHEDESEYVKGDWVGTWASLSNWTDASNLPLPDFLPSKKITAYLFKPLVVVFSLICSISN